MELVGALIIFLLLVGLFTDRPSRLDRARLEAFPRDRWTVYPSLEENGKYGLFRGGIEYIQFDTRAQAQAKKDQLDRIGC